MTPVETFHTPGTARPVGHYSQAVLANGFVFVAGQLPIDLTTGKPVVGTIEEQAELALRNLEKILVAAGSSLDRLVQVTVYLSSIDYWDRVNTVYARVLGSHRPARAIVPIGNLHHGVAIEIQAVAAA
jgi:2-iminobutanoate/2-iminopropanoate deaminase